MKSFAKLVNSTTSLRCNLRIWTTVVILHWQFWRRMNALVLCAQTAEFILFEDSIQSLLVWCLDLPTSSSFSRLMLMKIWKWNSIWFKLKELEKIVEDELCQKILKFKKDKKVAKSNFKKWCPEPDCNTICKVKTKLKAMKVCCPTCKKEFCSKCSQTWSQHPKKCEDFSGAPTKTELEESIDETKETRPCPVCKVPIQKRGGCYMITCRFCKSNFCWHCMEKVRRHLHIRCKGKINRELGLDIWTGFWIGLTWILVSPIIVLLIPVALSIRTYRLIRWVAPKVKKEIRILMTRLVLTLWNTWIWILI